MPIATEEQVPKPLTYTLMYHFLWFVMFALSGVMLTSLLLLSGWGLGRSLLAPAGLYALAVIAGMGAFITYGVRLQVLLGEFSREDAFQWSARSSWAILVIAPCLWAAWMLLEPHAQQWWNGGAPWSVPEAIASAVFKVEVVVWWLSHVLSIRGLSRGRRRYLAAAPAETSLRPESAGSKTVSRMNRVAGTSAADGMAGIRAGSAATGLVACSEGRQ